MIQCNDCTKNKKRGKKPGVSSWFDGSLLYPDQCEKHSRLLPFPGSRNREEARSAGGKRAGRKRSIKELKFAPRADVSFNTAQLTNTINNTSAAKQTEQHPKRG